MKSFVYCTLEFEARHSWPGCPFDEVVFLRFPHRHIFKVKAVKEVGHLDRDVEFITLKRRVQTFVSVFQPDAGSRSCEQMAKEILEAYGLVQCEVSEDGENGAVVVAEGHEVSL